MRRPARDARRRPPAEPERPAPPRTDPVPDAVTTGARYTGRMLVIGAGIAAVCLLAVALSEVVVPFLIGLVLSALLVPFASLLHRHRWPAWVAIATAWVVVFAVLAGLVLLVVWQVHATIPTIEHRVNRVVGSTQALLETHPFGLTPHKLVRYGHDILSWLQQHASGIGSGVLAAGSALTHTLEGVFIVVFVTLFTMIDGRGIWQWVVRLFPRRAQPRIAAAGEAGWHTLASFIRIQLAVAAIDAIGIGLGAFILRVPLAVPIAVLVFFGALIPVVGAIVAGAFAVAVALLFNGWIVAVIMLGVVVFVQQLEGHVLHPLLTGSAVKVHPLGVVLGVVTGTAVAGIAGAFFAVPVIATGNAMITAAHRTPAQGRERPGESAPGRHGGG